MAPITASIFADMIRRAEIGAVATRSGASSPEIDSHANPPPSWPAAITTTGTSTMSAPVSPKLRHNISAGGTR